MRTEDLLETDTGRDFDKEYLDYLEEKIKIAEKAKELSSFIQDEEKKLIWENGFVEGYFYRS